MLNLIENENAKKLLERARESNSSQQACELIGNAFSEVIESYLGNLGYSSVPALTATEGESDHAKSVREILTITALNLDFAKYLAFVTICSANLRTLRC